MTNKPSDCTHLVAPKVFRTEKFLCAMAAAPYILTDKWAINSAIMKALQRELLASCFGCQMCLLMHIAGEEDYLLHDEESEKKHNFQLAAALRRAQENDGRLFVKKIFYFTPKVSTNMALLRNVVTANGGQVCYLNALEDTV
jgi:hypothetical protein